MNAPSFAQIELDSDTLRTIISRLESDKVETEIRLRSLDTKLANERYTQSAPAKIVQETRDIREETHMLLSKLDEQLSSLKS